MRCPTSARTLLTVQAAARRNKARRHPLEQANYFVEMAKQKRAGIRGDRAAIETSHNFVGVEAFKFELRGDTVWLHRNPSCSLIIFVPKAVLRFLGPIHFLL